MSLPFSKTESQRIINRSQSPPQEDRLLKRARMDPKSNTEYDPTRVLFIRGLGPNVTERDIVNLCSEVGVVLQVFLLRHKGQSFVEFDSQEAAEFCLLHYSRNPVTLYGNNLHFSFSGREQVTKKSQELPQPNPELLLSIINVRYPITKDTIYKIFSPHGRLQSCKIFPRKFGYQVLAEAENTQQAIAARSALDGQNIYSGCNTIKAEYSPIPKYTSTVSENVSTIEDDHGSICFLHNIGDGANPDDIFNLFSLYGNVQRVKIFYKRRDIGLVQFEDPKQAETAIQFLNNITFFGKTLLVNLSKNNQVNMSQNDRHAQFCKDYTNSQFHRYKIAGSKNFKHMFPPSQVLHLSNLSDNLTESFFRELFQDQAYMTEFKFIGDQRRMALAKFQTVEDAIRVLVAYHNKNLNGRYLKIAFSKALM